MEQVNTILSRLAKGENIKSLVKEERRRVRRDLERKNSKPLKFKKAEESESVKRKEKKKKKDKTESAKTEEGLTRDEQMALEVYQAMRKKKESVEESEEEEEENEEDEGEDIEDGSDADDKEESNPNTYNNENEDIEEDDIEVDEKRGITYKIAKNKGLTPKRSKLQRNPRVKNRVKYQKAMKRRKGAVREVRDQNSKYGGEASGINIRVKKGVKFN